MIHNEAALCLERPAPYGAVLGPRDEILVVDANTHSVNWSLVTNQNKLTLVLDEFALFPFRTEI